jgi:hypothetical protein
LVSAAGHSSLPQPDKPAYFPYLQIDRQYHLGIHPEIPDSNIESMVLVKLIEKIV